MLISDEYMRLNAEVHQKSAHWGLLPTDTIKYIMHLLDREKIESVLDYGCGKGRLGKIMPHPPVQSYDPAIPEFSAVPKPADLVVCSSVLEHVEPDYLDDVLNDLKFLTWKLIVLAISTDASSYTLPDGRNSHLIQEPLEWWLPKLTARWKIKTINVEDRAFTFTGRV